MPNTERHSILGMGTRGIGEAEMSGARTIRGRVAIVGVGETAYYRHGRAPEPEFALALRAILRACQDAGIDFTI